MIHLSSNYTALDRELDRLEKLPGPKAKAYLDAVLQEAYVGSQAIVHVETGSLKASGKTESKSSRKTHTWEGDLEYGGASTGVNNPVDYAIYEKQRGVGGAGGPSDAKGDHNFIANVHLLHSQWIAAVKKGLSK